jgi:ubiquinone/menaquinone biosynthesis C-methylase UbiE
MNNSRRGTSGKERMRTPEDEQGAQQSVAALDEAKAEKFVGRFMESMNGAALILMTSIGHKTGLFDHLGEMTPATAHEIAEKAGLNERYVREWLAAMVMGEVVEYDELTQRYWLPREHAGLITRKGTPNLAVSAQFMPELANAEPIIIDRFRNGGGVGYEHYPHFHCVMAEESGQTTVDALFEHILPLVAGIDARLQAGIRVIDVGCGAGRAISAMAERYPKSTFVGLDICEDAYEPAQQRAREQGRTNLSFVSGDAATYQADRPFDLVTTFDAVHDQRDPQGLVQNIHRLLAEGGVYLMQDIGGSAHLTNNREYPMSTFLYTISCMHCMPVSLGQGGPGLGTMWGEETARQFLEEAGFEKIASHRLPHDLLNIYFFAHK